MYAFYVLNTRNQLRIGQHETVDICQHETADIGQHQGNTWQNFHLSVYLYLKIRFYDGKINKPRSASTNLQNQKQF